MTKPQQQPPEVSPEIQARARRHTIILYAVMIAMAAAPFLVFLFRD